ncbi:MAG: amidohydrolase [Chryseotalea sp. WA131a]|nr:MAG: amidohydrolase [Chryseotalea sp. WA131a]
MANADGLRLIEIFKDFHQNPELAFEEVRTAGIVAKELKALGFTTITGIAKTGVAGILKNGDGPIVMRRADMDCNAVKETTGLSYASTKTAKNTEGIEVPLGHMCGHDAHTTWLLGIAKMMVNLKKEWKGTLVLIGQPAEETGFGAIAMADEMYTKGVPVPNYLLGMHTGPAAVGLYLNMPGDRLAGADQIDITFYGISGHGSTPEQTKDPIVMAANAIIQYQTLISRNMDPQHPAVLTVGAVSAGTDNNVIPASATLKLNLRWYSEKDRSIMVDGINRINEGIAVANGLPKNLYPTFKQKQKLGPLNNDKKLVEKMNIALEKIFGPGKNLPLPPVMGSEDFHVLVRDYPNVPYDYMLIGVAPPELFAQAQKDGKLFPFSNHNGNFIVDLSAIPLGTAVGTAMVLEAFKK